MSNPFSRCRTLVNTCSSRSVEHALSREPTPAERQRQSRAATVMARCAGGFRVGTGLALSAIVELLFFGTTLLAQAQAGQSEYVPVKELPATEQLPAAPLVIAAYAAVWLIAMAYVWSVWRRLGKVERDMRELERREAQRARH